MAACRHRFGMIVLLGAAMTVAACDSSGSPAASRPAGSGPAATATTAAAPGRSGATARSGATDSAAPPRTPVPHLRFPNTDMQVQLVGYDSSLRMVEFRRIVGERTDDGTGHMSVSYYEPDPADPATHRLPMAAAAQVTSIDAELCPPTHCGPPEVMLGNLLGNDGQTCAVIHVNGSDHIDRVDQDLFCMGGDAPPPQDM